jgi:hypothetical protein
MNTNVKKLNKSILALMALGLLSTAGTASAAVSSAQCQELGSACVAESVATGLACAAAIAELGANPAADVGCGVLMTTTSATCKAMARDCPSTNRAGTVVNSGTMGTTTGEPTETFMCGNGTEKSPYNRVNRVQGVRFRMARIGAAGQQLRVSSVRLQCASGLKDLIGNPGVDGTGESNVWRGDHCGKSRQVQGIQARTGNGFMAMGSVCDYGTRSAKDTDNWLTGLRPVVTGGTVGTGTCKEGAYLYGLKVWYDKAAPLSQRYLKGLALICRGY